MRVIARRRRSLLRVFCFSLTHHSGPKSISLLRKLSRISVQLSTWCRLETRSDTPDYFFWSFSRRRNRRHQSRDGPIGWAGRRNAGSPRLPTQECAARPIDKLVPSPSDSLSQPSSSETAGDSRNRVSMNGWTASRASLPCPSQPLPQKPFAPARRSLCAALAPTPAASVDRRRPDRPRSSLLHVIFLRRAFTLE